jgi:sugar phosphate isomerase/epimerase
LQGQPTVKRLSYQLYSSRNFGPLSATLAKLAALGYDNVEGYGALYAQLADLSGLKALLDENGLKMPSGHFGLDMVKSDPDRVISIAETLGVEAVFVPHLAADQRPGDATGWTAFGQRLSKAGAPLRDAGLRFGWHNHDFEFAADGGPHPLDLILEGGADLDLEMDVAWVARAGQDPLAWITKYSDRIVAAHIKDIAPKGECLDEDGWADVGHGTIDWVACMNALESTNCELCVLEHDNPNDDDRFAKRSIAYLNSLQG